MNERRVVTERLTVVTATTQYLLVELDDPKRVGPLLGALVPAAWPPPLWVEGLTQAQWLHQLLETLHRDPSQIGWWMRYVVLSRGATGRPVLVGRVGLMGPPDDNGDVSVGCSLLEAFSGQGLGVEATGIVVDWALSQPGVQQVVVDVPPDHASWMHVLDKLSFERTCGKLAAETEAPIRFVRTRAAWQADHPASRRGAKLIVQPPHVPIAGIPAVAREVFERLMTEPLRDPEDLRREVQLYVRVIDHAAAEDPSVDHEIAHQIAEICEGLLQAVGPSTPEHTRRQIQGAVRYFVTEEDGDSDLAIGGLDEDAAVARAVAEHLGRSDLTVEST